MPHALKPDNQTISSKLEEWPFDDPYYKEAEEYVIKNLNQPNRKDLSGLSSFLMQVDYNQYVENRFDCSEMACLTEWLLEGAGFNTTIARGKIQKENESIPHAWVLVKLKNDEKVAVDGTYVEESLGIAPRNYNYSKTNRGAIISYYEYKKTHLSLGLEFDEFKKMHSSENKSYCNYYDPIDEFGSIFQYKQFNEKENWSRKNYDWWYNLTT